MRRSRRDGSAAVPPGRLHLTPNPENHVSSHHPRSAPARGAAAAPRHLGLVALGQGHRKWLFAAPAMVFVAVLIVFPVAWTGYLSLTDAEGSVRAESEFIGFQNYLDVLSDTDRFWPAVWRTVLHRRRAVLRGRPRHGDRPAAVAAVPR